MDVRSLRFFIEVASQGGFNRAAANLHIAQSAISRRVAKLEHELGTELLVRDHRRTQLTPAGALLLDKSQSLLRHFEQVRNEMLAEANEPRGELVLGLPPSLNGLSSTLLASLRERYPQLFVQVWVATSVDLRTMLLAGKVDLAVYAATDQDPAIETQPLFPEPLALLGAAGSVTRESTSWSAISALPLILTGRPNSVRLIVDAAAARRKRKLNVIMEVNDIVLMTNLTSRGAGFSILPASAVRELPLDRHSHEELPGLALSWVVGQATERPPSVAVKRTQELIREIFRPAPRPDLRRSSR
jgi:LysR family nitrogen assimilation transcriptional regulator